MATLMMDTVDVIDRSDWSDNGIDRLTDFSGGINSWICDLVACIHAWMVSEFKSHVWYIQYHNIVGV